ncbi:mucin-3A isoform X2 [Daphnia magna]|uniref:mucin-3A isoform X2 n=1 Tax=Daphnia magna TaxID=35525 RepID=UPI0014035D67|nr:mucin-3A isoform X2 [Daphnia magna]
MSLSNPLKCKSKSCFFCGVNYQDENKRIGIFGVPKKKFSIWQLIIPELKKTSYLCEKHFDQSDVLKGFTDGTVYHPYERWRLSISAFPKHFLGINEASSKAVKRTPLKQLFSVNTQQKKRDGIQAKISSVHSTSNNHQNLPSPLGNGANRHKSLRRTVGTENTPPNQHNKKLKLISHQAPSRVSKSNTPFQSVALPTLQHPETEIIGGSELMETDEPFNLPIDTVTTVEEDTVSCDTTTTSKSVDSPTLQHPETEIIGGSELMETGEHFNLPIEAETTVEEETVSCDTSTTSKSVALPPQQDPETVIIAGRDLMETGENLNLPIDILTTLEEEDSVSSDSTSTTSPPHQYRDSQLNGDSDHTETVESFELFNDRETTVEEDTASCETTTAFESVASPTLQHPETEIIGGIDLMETGEPFKFLIETETTRDTASCNRPTTTPFQLVASPPQQDPETEIITYKTTNLQAVQALFVSLPVPHSNELLSLPPEATETTHSSDVTTANETTDAEIVVAPTVRGKKPKRVYRIKAPTYCKCHKEIKGKCAPCQIRELKMLVQEKDKQLKIVRSYQVKATVDLAKLKCKLKEKDKKLNTSSKQLARMRQYAVDCVETISKLKDDVATLTKNQLDEKIKHLTHGMKHF